MKEPLNCNSIIALYNGHGDYRMILLNAQYMFISITATCTIKARKVRSIGDQMFHCITAYKPVIFFKTHPKIHVVEILVRLLGRPVMFIGKFDVSASQVLVAQ